MRTILLSFTVIILTFFAFFGCTDKDNDKNGGDIDHEQTDIISADIISHEFGAGAESVDINVESNVRWEVVASNDKFGFSPSSGKGKGVITVTASQNTSAILRVGELTIRNVDDHALSIVVDLTQRGINYIFTPQETTFNFVAAASEQTFTIDRAVGASETSIRTEVPWLEVSKTSSEQRETYTLRALANSSGVRNVDFTVRNSTGVIRVLKANQESTLSLNKIVLKANGLPVGDLITTSAKKVETMPLLLTEDPEDFNTYMMRNGAGSEGSWWRVSNDGINRDELWHDRQGSYLVIDENFGAERSVEVELYNVSTPQLVNKQFTLRQDAAQNYFTLSAPSLNMDLWGNVYYRPFVLSAQSNRDWQIEKSYADWITVSYTENRSSNVSISVKKNDTGVQRQTTLKFMSDGQMLKEFIITQGTNTDATFNLKYRLTLDIRTSNDAFKQRPTPHDEPIFVTRIEIFDNNRPSNVDRTSKFNNGSLYGFVIDAPTSANHLVASNLSHEYFYIKDYNGTSKSVGDNDTSLTGINSMTFFRQIRYNLPVPANVKQDEIVVFNVVINNLRYDGSYKYDTPIITSTIEKQLLSE